VDVSFAAFYHQYPELTNYQGLTASWQAHHAQAGAIIPGIAGTNTHSLVFSGGVSQSEIVSSKRRISFTQHSQFFAGGTKLSSL
jgi:hypothetical protein